MVIDGRVDDGLGRKVVDPSRIVKMSERIWKQVTGV